jgi:hypothetical protein
MVNASRSSACVNENRWSLPRGVTRLVNTQSSAARGSSGALN